MYYCRSLTFFFWQGPHFKWTTQEWNSYWEFPDMLQNWKDAIGWLVTALSSSCRVWQPLWLQITLHCTSQVAPGFLQLHLDVKLWAPWSDTGIYEELMYLTGGWWYAFDYHNCKIVDGWSYLFHSTTVYYGSSSIKKHYQISWCLCKLTNGLQNKHTKAIKCTKGPYVISVQTTTSGTTQKQNKGWLRWLFFCSVVTTFLWVFLSSTVIPCWHSFGSFYDSASSDWLSSAKHQHGTVGLQHSLILYSELSIIIISAISWFTAF